MKILVLEGPNLNLIGVKSAGDGQKITLDKINKGLRLHIKNTDTELKIFQTHKVYMAISFLQRNRNSSSGILIAPTSWSKYEYSLLETIQLIQIPFVQVLLDKNNDNKESIFSVDAIESVYDKNPHSSFTSGLTALINHLT